MPYCFRDEKQLISFRNEEKLDALHLFIVCESFNLNQPLRDDLQIYSL